MSKTGMDGFDGTELTLGSVFGIRCWNIRKQSATDREARQKSKTTLGVNLNLNQGDKYLCGSFGYVWEPGENLAVCKHECGCFYSHPSSPPPDHLVPDEDCGCGFWGYWTDTKPGWATVTGVIEGYGRTLLGNRGFRSEKARIRAVHVIDTWYEYDRTAASKITSKYGVPAYSSIDEMLEKHPLTKDYYVPEPEFDYDKGGWLPGPVFNFSSGSIITAGTTYTLNTYSGGGGSGGSSSSGSNITYTSGSGYTSGGSSISWSGGGSFHTYPGSCSICGDGVP